MKFFSWKFGIFVAIALATVVTPVSADNFQFKDLSRYVSDEDPAIVQKPIKTDEQGRPVLYIGLHQNHHPFSYFAQELRRRAGFTVDVVTEICKRLKAQCKVMYGNYTDIEMKLLKGQLDLALGNFFELPSTQDLFLYSDYIIKSYPVIVSSDYSLAFASADDLRSFNFGVRADSYEQALMERQRTLSHISYYTIYGSHTEMFKALKHGDVDALYIGNLSAYGFTGIDNSTLYITGDKFHKERPYGKVRMILPKDHEALREKLNELIAQMKEDRTLYRLALDYMPFVDNGL